MRSWARGATILTLVFAFTLLFGPSAQATTGYHHTGAQTTQQFEGADAQIEVTDPSLPGNPCTSTTDFFAARIMLKQGAWMEAGWAEVGWLTPGLCSHARSIYVFDTLHGVWEFFLEYTLTTGSTLRVRVYSDASCDGNAPCIYRSQIYWGGQWVTLHAASINLNSNAYVEEMGEVYTAGGTHFQIASGGDADVDWYNTRLLKSDRTWHLWQNAPTLIGDNIPYYTSWLINYYRFQNYRG
ncbi:MAG: hypothetical protein WEB06_03755 [Actinomycetota bacterium]